MGRFRIKLALPAVRFYQRLSSLAAADKGNSSRDLLVSVDTVIDDILPLTPSTSGVALKGAWAGVHWLSFNGLHYFYEMFPHARIVQIFAILDGPIADDRMQKADELCTEILLANKARISPPASKAFRAMAN